MEHAMSSSRAVVQDHYGRGGLLGRIEAALAANGRPVDTLDPEMLYPLDQLHSRQLVATKDHLARLHLDSAKHVLDIGSGIGGPARYMAATFGCRVTGIDLTEEFVAVARELTRRCGLAERVAFECGDAMAMPFEDESFDAASCLHVAMNIPDKPRLLSETARALKPGAWLVWSVVVAGSGGEPQYPMPWAQDTSGSFLVVPEALRPAFADAGFRVVEWSDETPTQLDYAAKMRAAGRPAPGSLTNQIVLGEVTETVANLNRNLAEGRLRVFLIVAERA
jgi:ubiquinone/menaquinone biosynthesis C-methylase UbiE